MYIAALVLSTREEYTIILYVYIYRDWDLFLELYWTLKIKFFLLASCFTLFCFSFVLPVRLVLRPRWSLFVRSDSPVAFTNTHFVKKKRIIIILPFLNPKGLSTLVLFFSRSCLEQWLTVKTLCIVQRIRRPLYFFLSTHQKGTIRKKQICGNKEHNFQTFWTTDLLSGCKLIGDYTWYTVIIITNINIIEDFHIKIITSLTPSYNSYSLDSLMLQVQLWP